MSLYIKNNALPYKKFSVLLDYIFLKSAILIVSSIRLNLLIIYFSLSLFLSYKANMSEGNNVNKANESRKSTACNYYYFLKVAFRFKPE